MVFLVEGCLAEILLAEVLLVDGQLVQGLLVQALLVEVPLVEGYFVKGLIVEAVIFAALLVEGFLVDGCLVEVLLVQGHLLKGLTVEVFLPRFCLSKPLYRGYRLIPDQKEAEEVIGKKNPDYVNVKSHEIRKIDFSCYRLNFRYATYDSILVFDALPQASKDV